MQLRKILALICAVCLLCCPTVAADGGAVIYDESNGEKLQDLLDEDDGAWPTVALPEPGELAVKAKGAVLMDLGSGRVLYEQDSRKRVPIASVTKVMTLLLVMEALEAGRIQWTDPVTCSSAAAGIGGSQIWLEAGEIMTVEELVKAAAVVSANDACAALAEHLCGSVPVFVAAMNKRAEELGMQDTEFKDCSGLDDSGYSCAYDVAVMSRALMKHSEIERFTTIWTDSLRGGQSQLVNTNKLIRHYMGATGLKTGTTNAAGHCLTATARREGTAFAAVVLGCATTNDRWQGARTLLDYGFAHYATYTPSTEGLVLNPVPVLRGQAAQVAVEVDAPTPLLLDKGSEGRVESRVEMAADLQAPVLEGQTVGTWRLTVGDETVGEYPIRTTCAVPAVTFRWAYSLLMNALLR
ncbi:MAG: D-alanyl-D-alanine carboxypeptidase [Clostridia bacterium]|nr:D-alanyl-D-alanine carboxypeptidase [Clostridia bacterium]